MNHIFIDLEMTGSEGKAKANSDICKHEIIQIGAVMIDKSNQITKEFSSYVKPRYNEITDFYENLTGISNEMVCNAPDLKKAMVKFLDWLGSEEYLIYSWSKSDLGQLKKEMEIKSIEYEKAFALFDHWVDYQEEFGKLLGLDSKIALKAAIKAIGIKFEGTQHDALWDAKNTAKIFLLSQNEKEFNEVMKPLLELFQPQESMTYSIGELFADKLQGFHGVV